MALSIVDPSQALRQAAVLTFEELGFMFLEAELCAAAAPLAATANVAFRGPFTGRLQVAMSAGVLAEITANMLGEVSSPSLVQQCDALGEIANVVCGNVLPRIAGSHQIFRLAAPVVGDGVDGVDAPGAHAAGAAGVEELAAAIELPVSEGRALLRLFFDRPN